MTTTAKSTTKLLLQLRKWAHGQAVKLAVEEARLAALPATADHPDRWQALGADNAQRLQNIGRLLLIDPVEREVMLQQTLRLTAAWRNFGALTAFDTVAQTTRLRDAA